MSRNEHKDGTSNAKPIWKIASETGSQIPEEEWEKFEQSKFEDKPISIGMLIKYCQWQIRQSDSQDGMLYSNLLKFINMSKMEQSYAIKRFDEPESSTERNKIMETIACSPTEKRPCPSTAINKAMEDLEAAILNLQYTIDRIESLDGTDQGQPEEMKKNSSLKEILDKTPNDIMQCSDWIKKQRARLEELLF